MQNTGKADCFGSIVKTTRKKKGLTQSKLAEKLSISIRYLKAIENSGRKPSYDLLVKIIHELDIQTNMLFYPEQVKGETANTLVLLGK